MRRGELLGETEQRSTVASAPRFGGDSDSAEAGDGAVDIDADDADRSTGVSEQERVIARSDVVGMVTVVLTGKAALPPERGLTDGVEGLPLRR